MEITQVTRDHFYEGEKPNESSTFSLICGKRKKWNVKDHKTRLKMNLACDR